MKIIRRFSSCEMTQHKIPFCLVTSNLLRTTKKCIEHMFSVSLYTFLGTFFAQINNSRFKAEIRTKILSEILAG
jgi:hypothetical protein